MKKKMFPILLCILMLGTLCKNVHCSENKQEKFQWNSKSLLIGVNDKATMTFDINNTSITNAYLRMIFTQGFDSITDYSYLYVKLNGDTIATILLNDKQLQLYTLDVKLPIYSIKKGENIIVISMTRIPSQNGAIKTDYYNYLTLDEKTSIYIEYK